MPVYERDYKQVAMALSDVSGNRHRRMHEVCDVLWRFFKDFGVSWVGFYEKDPDAEQMILGPSRDKPACSPIGLHGACGQAALTKTTLVITDVAKLGEGYVACDPRDLSELVIPLLDESGDCWGVYDADSFDVGSFDEQDADCVRELMVLARLTTDAPVAIKTI